MQMEQILKLVETVSHSTLSSFQYEEEGSCLILKQQLDKEISENKVEPMIEQKGEVVTSPLVGMFYSQPSAGAKPYVEVGDTVKKGQVIGIIESMKLMNEIEASRDGIILEILVKNEQLVEYGQGIVRIG